MQLLEVIIFHHQIYTVLLIKPYQFNATFSIVKPLITFLGEGLSCDKETKDFYPIDQVVEVDQAVVGSIAILRSLVEVWTELMGSYAR